MEFFGPSKATASAALNNPENTKRVLDQTIRYLQELSQVIDDARPDVIAVETVFTNRNLQTAISVGRASGVALLAAAQADIPVYEYVPTAIKSAVTGDGSANKKQMQEMVARLLKLREPPKPADAADALALALCHLRVSSVQVTA